MTSSKPAELSTADALREFVRPERQARIDQVIAGRTRDIAVVMDGTHDLGNIHAVVRTAEGLGFDQIHVVESAEKLRRANRTSQGADSWVDFFRYQSPDACIAALRHQGYQLLVTTLEGEHTLEQVDFSKKTAIVLGNEKLGVSSPFLAHADVRVRMPMSGFAQSFNVSVAGAIVLWSAFQDRCRRLGSSGNLTESERYTLRDRYYSRSVRESEAVARLVRERASNCST
jgi:tRNA (guanosine-2'-O-)-methyltransferase